MKVKKILISIISVGSLLTLPVQHLYAQESLIDPNVKLFPDQGDTAAENLLNRKCVPEYPRPALRNEMTGISVAQMTVTEKGELKKAKIVSSSGFRILDNALMDALKYCWFKPGMVNGKPVQDTMIQQYIWRLD